MEFFQNFLAAIAGQVQIQNDDLGAPRSFAICVHSLHQTQDLLAIGGHVEIEREAGLFERGLHQKHIRFIVLSDEYPGSRAIHAAHPPPPEP